MTKRELFGADRAIQGMSTLDDAIFHPALDPASVSLPQTIQVDLTWLWADLGARPEQR